MLTRWHWPPESWRGYARGMSRPKADELEQLRHAGRALLPRELAVVDEQREGDDLLDRLALVQRRVRVLEDDLHLATQPAELPRGNREHVLRIEVDLARRGPVEPEQQPGERRLPRAGLADETERLSAREHERHVVDRMNDPPGRATAEPEMPAEVLDDDERVALAAVFGSPVDS